MNFLPNEEIINTGITGFQLTNKRIRLVANKEFHSMLPSEVSSIHIAHKSNQYYLVLAAIGLCGMYFFYFMNCELYIFKFLTSCFLYSDLIKMLLCS